MRGISLGRRLVGAIIIQIVVAAGYAALAAAGFAPLPASVADIAAATGSIGRGPRIVAGYYISQPFTSFGSGLPPYVFAQDTAKDSPSVHVTPSLADVKAGKVAAIIDTSTGDGSQWSPDVAHTIAGWQTFLIGVIVGAVVLIIVELWLGGRLAYAFARRRSGAMRRALQKQA